MYWTTSIFCFFFFTSSFVLFVFSVNKSSGFSLMTVFVLIFVNRKNTVVTVFSCIADGGLTEVFADFCPFFAILTHGDAFWVIFCASCLAKCLCVLHIRLLMYRRTRTWSTISTCMMRTGPSWRLIDCLRCVAVLICALLSFMIAGITISQSAQLKTSKNATTTSVLSSQRFDIDNVSKRMLRLRHFYGPFLILRGIQHQPGL